MDTASLHSPLARQVIETTNEGRLDDFMALFVPGAAVVDGPTYQGLQAIRDWAQRETFGVQMRFDVVQENNAEGTSLEVLCASQGGYSGQATFDLSIRGSQIERLEIS